jgi:hypothetical protein
MKVSKHCPDCPKQCFCGSSQQLEANHLGGKNHASGITQPYCLSDHTQFHTNCQRAGVDFRKQTNPILSKLQALKAHIIGIWMVVENMEEQVKRESQEQVDDTKE